MIASSIHALRTDAKRLFSRWQSRRELKLVRAPARATEKSGVIAFAVLRNETLRLPAYFRHYDNLGVTAYVIVDNNSTDGTSEYLASRDDVILYSASADFVGKERWINYLLRRYGRGRWCLVADADELLDYPRSDVVTLPALCRYLERCGANALHAVLLDLYPDVPLSGLDYRQGDDYFDREWYFDPFTSLEKSPRFFYRGSGLDFRFKGGVRKRLFGVQPCCSKFPLLRFEPPMFLTDGQHYIEGAHFSGLRAVLYHFKYLQDFAAHVTEEAGRRQYVWAGDEYSAYAALVSENPSGLVFRDASSIRLTGISQLEQCGFAVAPPDYEAYAQRLGPTTVVRP